MITKDKLREVISEWIKPMCQECEGIGGFWIHSSTTGVFSWTLYIDSSSRDRTISARLCYDQNNHHTGYIIYLNLDDDHPIIKITGDYLIDCISDDNSHNFNKEWLCDLLNRIRQAMGQNISEPEIHSKEGRSAMIIKERLKVIIQEWISPLFKGPERNLNGYFWWMPEPKTGVSKISISLNQISQIGGDKYHIYIDGFKDHPVIVISNDTISLHLERSFGFNKDSLRDLYDRINEELKMLNKKSETEVVENPDTNDFKFPVTLQQVKRTILDWFNRHGEKDIEIEKVFETDGFIRINWISKIMPIELRSSYNHKHEFIGYDIFGGKPISEYPFILMRSDNIYFNRPSEGFMIYPIPEGFMSYPILERYMYSIFEMIKEAVYNDQIQKQMASDFEDFISRAKALNIKSFRNELMNHEAQPTVHKSKEYEEQQTLMKFAREIRKIVEEEETMKQPEIKKFFYSGHTTVVIWDDGTKTMSSPSGDEMFDPEMGLAMAVAKKYFGNRHKFEKVVADGLYGKYLDDYKKMFVDKWTKNLKKKNTEEKLYAYNQILNALIDVKNNIRKHIDEELKKHEVDKKEFEKKLEEYEEAVKAGKKPKRPVLNSHRTPEMRDFQVRLKAIKDLITLIEQRIKKLEG